MCKRPDLKLLSRSDFYCRHKQFGEKRFLWLTFQHHNPSWREVRSRTQAGPEAQPVEAGSYCLGRWLAQFSFSFQFVYVVDYRDTFLYLEPCLNLWDEAYLIVANDLFEVFLDSPCMYFIGYFCIYIHKRNWSVVSFL